MREFLLNFDVSINVTLDLQLIVLLILSHLLIQLFNLIIIFVLNLMSSLLSQLCLHFLNPYLQVDFSISKLTLVLIGLLNFLKVPSLLLRLLLVKTLDLVRCALFNLIDFHLKRFDLLVFEGQDVLML